MNTAVKRKSQKRFEQLNHIVDKLLCQLPARLGVALLVFYRHADVNRRFRVSNLRLAKTLDIDERNSRKLFRELQRLGAINLIEPEQGTIPRLFEITGRVVREDGNALPM